MTRIKTARRSSPSQHQVTKKRRLTRSEVVTETETETDYHIKNSRQVQKALHLPSRIYFEPKTEPQRQMIEAWASNLNIAAVGSAGSGKTYIGMALALQSLLDGDCEKIIIVRTTVQVREQGFLPGGLEEKQEPFTAPYKAIVNELMGNGIAWDVLYKKKMIEFMSTSFIRGITIKNAVVLFDEIQDANFQEWVSVMTRMGTECRFIACGDTKQNDLVYKKNDTSGLPQAIQVLRRMPKFVDVINFLPQDIIRSGFVRAWILECEELGY